jgi:hypothetical protein
MLRAYLLLVLLGAALGASTCTGASTKLPQDECDAYEDFFDKSNGDTWYGGGAAGSCKRSDPCGCYTARSGGHLCNTDGTAIVTM